MEIKSLMAKNQADIIVSTVTANMLEWGSGGTTLYLLQNLGEDQRLTSIEHDPTWFKEVKLCAHNTLPPEVLERWDYRLVQGGYVGENASMNEEVPCGLFNYIWADKLPLWKFDTFLVDGVARGACLSALAFKGKSGADVFLHDVQRPWYDWALELFDGGILIPPDDGDYPAQLWQTKVKRKL